MTPIIPSTTPSIGTLSLTPVSGKTEQPGTSFKELMLESLKHVNSMQHDADQAVQQLMTGGDVDPAEVLTAIQKADMTFRMMLQIRNKLVQAYQEVNQIRI
jgi:flagellar hook-basal body complex protein FliE